VIKNYKVEIRNCPDWRAYSAATLGVSIESPNWKEEKFAAILDFAAKRFKLIRIDVTDALYRHNFMAAGVPEGEAFVGAAALGTLWLAKHQDIIDKCRVETQIVRWSEWLSHPDYERVIKLFKIAYENNPIFRKAVERDAMRFYLRQENKNIQTGWPHSVDFLIEEAAVISLQARELSSVRLYPGDELECLRLIRSGCVDTVPRWLCKETFAKVRFRLSKNEHSSSPRNPDLRLVINQ
jgi:tRNA-dependent cyclodipeptide synthase